MREGADSRNVANVIFTQPFGRTYETWFRWNTETNADATKTAAAAGLDMALTIIAAAITLFLVRSALINNPPYFKQTLSTYANTKYVCGTADEGIARARFGLPCLRLSVRPFVCPSVR